jgi:tRNA(adenine34) deaminase
MMTAQIQPLPVPDGPTAAEAEAMGEAIDRAWAASREHGKAGIAATILRDGRIIATGENEVHLQADPTRHAEVVAIARATKAIGQTDLSGCVILSTLQPCEMCLAAIRFAGIDRIIFAARQENVAEKYFAFPHLQITDFQTSEFAYVGGVEEHRVLALYEHGDE